MPKLLVTGGVQRANAHELGEGRRYRCGRLVRVDYENRAVETLVELDKGGRNYPDDTPNLLFTSATLDDGRLYLCSETEVFIYSYPEIKLERRFSFPFFQNIHHVAPIGNYIVVASTGLDMVVAFDKETLAPAHFWNTLGKDPWGRFSRDKDYRKVHSTKPHESHPNFVFSVCGEIWVTRFEQKDAVCLGDLGKRIDIGIERIHDGHVCGDSIYFTAVSGHIVIADIPSRSVVDVVNLNELDGVGCPLGWCRGLAVVDDIAYVGFSRIRETPLKENLLWMTRWAGKPRIMPTRIARYDLRRRVKLDELVLTRLGLDCIYSVIAVGD